MDFSDLSRVPLRTTRAVDTPKRGGSVFVRELLGIEALQLRERISAIKNIEEADGQAQACAVQLSSFLCDENGATIATVDQALQLLSLWYPTDIFAVIRAGSELNGADDKAVEDAAKK